jgi:hypothetical protein
MSQEFTDKQLIEKYVWMRDLVAVKKKALADQIKPYTAGMEVIEAALMARLIQRGADNTKTDAGTAYKATLLTVKVEDREAFLEYVMSGEDGSDAMLLAQPQKDAVKDYIDKYQKPPPGIGVNYFTNVNVRKS